MSNSGVQQNQLQLKNLILTSGKESVDLSNIFISMTIYEDLFASCVSGHISLYDARAIMEVLPIMGEETLYVEYTTYSKGSGNRSFSKTFEICKSDDFQPSDDNTSSGYTLHFQSKIMSANLKNRYKTSFGNSVRSIKSSEIVQNVCVDMLGLSTSEIVVDETSTFNHLVCANWTPFQLINHVAETSLPSSNIGLKDNNNSYLFFEDRFGVKFVSLGTLLEGKLYGKSGSDVPIKSLVMRQEAVRKDNVGVMLSDINKVLEWRAIGLFNNNENTRHGMYSSTTHYYDTMGKNVESVVYDYDADFTNQSHVNSATKLTRNRVNLPLEASFMYDTKYNTNNIQSVMKSKYQQLENNNIVVTVSGCSGYMLGQLLSFDIPSTLISNNKRESMKFLSGDFLLTRIKSTMTRETIINDLELRKGCRSVVI